MFLETANSQIIGSEQQSPTSPIVQREVYLVTCIAI